MSFVVDVLVGAEYSTDSFVTEESTQIRVTTQIVFGGGGGDDDDDDDDDIAQ